MIILSFLLLLAATPSDTFVFNNTSEPGTLDPHRISSVNDANLSLQSFESLVGRDQDYATLRPAIAESWSVSKDGKTYTFKIRKGLKWSNGEPLTIEQIRGSLLRAMWPQTLNQFVQWYTGNIVGAEDYVESFKTKTESSAEKKVGINIKDSHTLQMVLKTPVAQFIEYVATPSFAIVHPSMYGNGDEWKNPEKFICNGPYRLTSWTVNKDTRYEKNPHYWDASRVKIPKLVVLGVTEEMTAYNLYRTEAVDWSGENVVPIGLIASLRSKPDFYLNTVFGTYYYLFNVTRKPFDDLRVRRALSLALHRAEIVDKVSKGGQVPTHRLVPGVLKDFKPTIVPPQPYDKQIEEARRLLAEAGYPGGKGFPRMVLKYNTAEGHHKIAQAAQQMWKKNLGIEIGLENKEWNVFLKEQSSKNFDMARQSWMGDIPDPAAMLDVFVTGGGNNHSSWSNARFDELLKKAAKELKTQTRMKLYAEAEEILLKDTPFIPIYHYTRFGLMSPRIKGFKPNLFGIHQAKFLEKR